MKENIVLAVAGATGLVGESMLGILAERRFPAASVHALASARSVGRKVSYGSTMLTVQNLAEFDFEKVDIALFSAGGSVSEEHATRAAAQGCVVIDNTSFFRYDDDVPLIVPEVNKDAIGQFRQRNIIANPNCSTIQMLVALKPIYDKAGIERINVATYQAVSGAGRSAVEQLAGQTARLMNGRPLDDDEARIGFNVRPHIDSFLNNGYTREEMKMVWETQKILDDDSVLVNATAVRVPVFFGHSEAVHIETRDKLSADQARELLKKAPGVTLLDRHAVGGYPTAATNAAGTDPVFVGRIREDISHPRGLDMWVVSDNVRKGAALNSVQIAESLVKDHL
ncbi:MAG: aspartate-semialdehyde dehydrogenase [Gammaproteobacteria bacterium]|nr:aspartate-semialdehyde dehydrogenase [Gammaproteobacteria bacterium]